MMPTHLEALTMAAVKEPLLWLRRYTPAAVPARFAGYHQALTELPEPGQAQARVIYRGSAKTTITRATVLHSAIHRKARGIVYVRATFGDAKSDREALERMAALAGVEAATDGDQKMVLVSDVPIWTRTPGGAVRGIHWINPRTGEVVRPDLIVIDDLETRKSARSAEQTKVIAEWVTSDLMQVAGPGRPARVLMLGTPITSISLVARAMRREPPFDSWLEPMVQSYENEDGSPAWADTHDPGLRARTPDITMATEYDLDPLPPGTLLFPRRLTQWVSLGGTAEHRCIIAVDPAGDGDDATSAVAVALTPRGLYVIDCLHHTGVSTNAPEAIARFVRRIQGEGWAPMGVTVEGVGGWEFFRRELGRMDLNGLRVTGETPTDGKVDRALPLTVWHKNHALAAHPRLQGTPWDTEFHSFQQDGETSTGHDDTVDASSWAAKPITRGWQLDPPDVAWQVAA